MLESGYTVFDCQIVKPLENNSVYQSYLVNCPDSIVAKLFLLLPDPLIDSQQRQSFLDHADWLSNQDFSGVGAPLKAGEVDDNLACLYPYPHGTPLRQSFTEGFSVRQSVELIKKISFCLSTPHSAGLWHGNLSPETIYLEDDSPYLADFSLSQLARLDYHSGIDPQYTSPEQVRGEMSRSAADIYNLGCIFYHLLTGQPPFSGEDAFAIAKQHLQDEFPLLPNELALLQPLLNSMTDMVAENRSNIDELIDQIDKVLESQEIDLINVSASLENQQIDDVSSEKSPSLLDEARDGSEIAARIEARLKEHASDFKEPELLEEEGAVADGLEQNIHVEKGGLWKFVLVLLFGVAIGSGLFFVLDIKNSAITPVVVEPEVNMGTIFVTDLDQSLQLWQEADFNGAETGFKQIIADYQEDPRAYNNLAAFYAAQGNYDQARDYLEQALATDESYATIYRNLGSVYAEMARGSYGRALQLDRTNEFISLPVFSSQGVVKLKLVTGVATIVPEDRIEAATVPSPLSKAARQITAVEAVPIDEPKSSPVVISEQPEALTVVAAAGTPQVDTEEPPVVLSELEPSGERVSSDVVEANLHQENAEDFLQRWAQAWSDQNVAAYLSFYSEEFVPPAGRNRLAWEKQRRTRLLTPQEIQIGLDEFQTTLEESILLRVEVIQSYKSNLLTDRFKKVFDLQRTANSWEILRERSLGRVR